jgi:hypothetical protein
MHLRFTTSTKIYNITSFIHINHQLITITIKSASSHEIVKYES